MRHLSVIIFTLVSIAGSQFAAAWGKQGHRISSQISEHYLSEDAKALVESILGVETLAEASTWPDYMRSNPSTFWQRQSMWLHFVTLPEDEREHNKNGDAISALKDFSEIIKDKNRSLEERQKALRFAVHIITDLHQPFHAGNGKDRGGNDVKLKFFGEDTNLHSIWDTKLIDHEKLSYTEWASWLQPKITAQQAKDWCVTDPMIWARESRALNEGLYPGRKSVKWQYIYKTRPILRKRLMQGGVRLACYLNEVAKN